MIRYFLGLMQWLLVVTWIGTIEYWIWQTGAQYVAHCCNWSLIAALYNLAESVYWLCTMITGFCVGDLMTFQMDMLPPSSGSANPNHHWQLLWVDGGSKLLWNISNSQHYHISRRLKYSLILLWGNSFLMGSGDNGCKMWTVEFLVGCIYLQPALWTMFDAKWHRVWTGAQWVVYQQPHASGITRDPLWCDCCWDKTMTAAIPSWGDVNWKFDNWSCVCTGWHIGCFMSCGGHWRSDFLGCYDQETSYQHWSYSQWLLWYGCFWVLANAFQWTMLTAYREAIYTTQPWTAGRWCKLLSGLSLHFHVRYLCLNGKVHLWQSMKSPKTCCKHRSA